MGKYVKLMFLVIFTLAVSVFTGCGGGSSSDNNNSGNNGNNNQQPQTYSVSFYSNGGSSVLSQSRPQGGTVSEPTPTPTRTGYGFGGWYTDNNTFLNRVTFPYTVTGNVTLYARWTSQYRTVTFNIDGEMFTTVQVEYNSGIGSSMPLSPTKNGYTFVG